MLDAVPKITEYLFRRALGGSVCVADFNPYCL